MTKLRRLTALPAVLPPGDRLLTTREAGGLLNASDDSLLRWRLRGIGPRYSRIGEGRGLIRYRLSDIQNYVTSVTVPGGVDVPHDEGVAV